MHIRLLGDKKELPVLQLEGDINNTLFRATLESYNKKGYGIHYNPNTLVGGLRDEHCVDVTSQFIDMDSGTKQEQMNKIRSFPIPASKIIETRRGYHCYWELQENSSKEQWIIIQKKLIQHFSSDSGLKNLSHCMRLEGFYHMKEEPFLVSVIEKNDLYYSQSQFDFLEDVLVEEKKEFSVAEIVDSNRNETVFKTVASLMSKGFSEAVVRDMAVSFNKHQVSPPLKYDELEKILKTSLERYEIGKLEVPIVNKFPIEMLPTNLKAIIVDFAESIQIDESFVAMYLLGTIGGLVAKKCSLEMKPGVHTEKNSNLYVMCVLNPSERKSSVVDIISRPIFEFERTFNDALPEDDVGEMLHTQMKKLKENTKTKAEDIIALRQEITKHDSSVVRRIKTVVDNITKEKLATTMFEQNGRIMMLSAEGNFWNQLMAYQTSKEADITLYLKTWAGDRVLVDRQDSSKKPISIVDPALSIVLTAQPSVLKKSVSDPLFRSLGLVARFCYVFPKSLIGQRKYDSRPVPIETTFIWTNLVDRLMKLPKESKTLRFSTKAQDIYKEFAIQHEILIKQKYSHMQDWYGKLTSFVGKLAMIFHMVEGNDTLEVSEQNISLSIEIGHFLTREADAKVFRKDGLYEEFIQQNIIAGETTTSDLYNSFEAMFGKELSRKAILKLSKDLGFELGERVGRSQIRVFV